MSITHIRLYEGSASELGRASVAALLNTTQTRKKQGENFFLFLDELYGEESRN